MSEIPGDPAAGDLIVYETPSSFADYTTIGRVEKLPPFEDELLGEVREITESVKVRTTPNLPSYTMVSIRLIRGLASEVDADTGDVYDWED